MVLRGPQRMAHSGSRMHESSSICVTTPVAQKEPATQGGVQRPRHK